MLGKGLINGLKVTLGHLFEKNITQQYPEQKPQLSPRSRCSFKLDSDKCNACTMCAISCPNKVITVTGEKDENNKKHVNFYEMQLMNCLFCGLCVEACPSKALDFTQDFELSVYDKAKTKLTLHHKEDKS